MILVIMAILAILA